MSEPGASHDSRTSAIARLVEAALDGGVKDLDTVVDHVNARLGALETAKEMYLGVLESPRERERQFDWSMACNARIGRLPRGAWAAVFRIIDGTPVYDALMSDGSGRVAGGAHLSRTASVPTFDATYRLMLAGEVAPVFKEIEHRRQIEANKEAIQDFGIERGQTFKNLTIRGAFFTTATISAISDAGYICLRLLNETREKPKTLISSISATDFVKFAELRPVAPAPAP